MCIYICPNTWQDFLESISLIEYTYIYIKCIYIYVYASARYVSGGRCTALGVGTIRDVPIRSSKLCILAALLKGSMCEVYGGVAPSSPLDIVLLISVYNFCPKTRSARFYKSPRTLRQLVIVGVCLSSIIFNNSPPPPR